MKRLVAVAVLAACSPHVQRSYVLRDDSRNPGAATPITEPGTCAELRDTPRVTGCTDEKVGNGNTILIVVLLATLGAFGAVAAIR